jgi:hypothetical protein
VRGEERGFEGTSVGEFYILKRKWKIWFVGLVEAVLFSLGVPAPRFF